MLEQPEFGLRLRELRVERRLSLSDLSGPGMSISYLSRLESGARPPTEKSVAYLAERLNVSQSTLAAATPAVAPVLSRLLATAASGAEITAETLREALTRQEADPGVRWQALWLLAATESRQGLRDEERATLESLSRLSDEIQDPVLRVRARSRLARCLRSIGDISGAYKQVTEAVALSAEHDLTAVDRARAIMLLVSAEAELGRLAEAREHADDLLRTVPGTPNTLHVEALWTAASVRIRQGDHGAAGELMEQALQLAVSQEDLLLWMRLRLAAAALYLQMQPPRTDQAQQRLAEAAPALHLIGTPLHLEEFQLLEATLAFQLGDVDRAHTLSGRLRDNQQHLTFRDRIRLDMLFFRMEIATGDREAAMAGMKQLAGRAQEAANMDLAAEIWRTLAEALSA